MDLDANRNLIAAALARIPGGDRAALQLVIVAVVISLAALVASEWFARRAAARLHGA
jgi:molybdate transport system permease protein